MDECLSQRPIESLPSIEGELKKLHAKQLALCPFD